MTNILKKIEIVIQEIGYDYVLDGNGIIAKESAVSFRERNDYIQIFGGACPFESLPDINRANRYFEKRNAAFKYGEWVVNNGNHFALVERISTSGFNSLSKEEAKEVIKGFITEFSQENKAVIRDLLLGQI